MAAPRETAFIYAHDEEEGRRIAEILENHHLAVQLRLGGLPAAVAECSSWNIAPHYFLVDVSSSDDPVLQFTEIQERGPSGETDVIAFGDQDNVGLYRSLRRIHVAEYLTRPLQMDDFDLVVTQLIQARRDETKALDPERIICVTGTRGGCGASTVAAGLANIISSQHQRRTLLLDLDMAGGTQYVNFNIEATPGLIDMMESPHRIDAVFLERTLGVAGQRLVLLSADKPEEERDPKPEGLDALLRQAGQGIDTVVLDLPRGPSFASDSLYSAGTVILVTPSTIIGLRDTVNMLAEVEKAGTARRVLVVCNKVGEFRSGNVTTNDYSRRLGRTVFEVPFDSRGVQQAVVRGIPVNEGSSMVGRALSKIAAQLPSSGTLLTAKGRGRRAKATAGRK